MKFIARGKLMGRVPPLYLVAAALILFNNWVLGFIFNLRLISAGGTVSQLSANTQPAHWLFRSLDILSGIALVMAAYIISVLIRRSRGRDIILWSTVTLGFFNILDALLPLNCASVVDKNCVEFAATSAHLYIPSHIISTVPIALSLLALPIGGLMLARKYKNELAKRLYIFSLILLGIMALAYAAAIMDFISPGGIFDKFVAPTQLLHMSVFGVWYVYYYSAAVKLQE